MAPPALYNDLKQPMIDAYRNNPVSIKLKGEPDEDFPIWNVGKAAKHSKAIAPMAQFGGGARDPLSAFLHYFASNSP